MCVNIIVHLQAPSSSMEDKRDKKYSRRGRSEEKIDLIIKRKI